MNKTDIQTYLNRNMKKNINYGYCVGGSTDRKGDNVSPLLPRAGAGAPHPFRDTRSAPGLMTTFISTESFISTERIISKFEQSNVFIPYGFSII